MPGTRKLGKTTDQRMAMLRQQVTDFLDNGKMETTVTRAKEIKPLAEKMITLGKKNTLVAKRQAIAFLKKEAVVYKLFTKIAPLYDERNGGYTRVLKIGPRRGDGAEMAIIELVGAEELYTVKEEKKEGKYIRREFAYTRFHQTLILPENAEKDKIEAKVENGVLKVCIPKLQIEGTEPEKRIIEVK